ncbi:Os12g0500225 [Oryza sativa Japonica Group]|uniref:Os12g0500225 protein n=1 Tax=Oryza sativa subsp. japonica TaxID=39947 RepID=A0A0P0YAG7_ORYSJ|nr:Os12g0500225 [Oryza sativa Japonica Group]
MPAPPQPHTHHYVPSSPIRLVAAPLASRSSSRLHRPSLASHPRNPERRRQQQQPPRPASPTCQSSPRPSWTCPSAASRQQGKSPSIDLFGDEVPAGASRFLLLVTGVG